VLQGDAVERYVPFALEVQCDRERVIVAPHGEIDIATVGEVRAALDEVECVGFQQVVLDLRGVTFIDSTGLKLILAELGKDGIDFAVIRGPRAVQRLFEVTGLLRVVPFVDR